MAPAVVLDEHYFLISAIVTVGFQLLGFAIAYTAQIDKVTDLWGSANFIILAVMTLILGGAYHPRQILLVATLILSRCWLAGFLLYRVCSRGHDARFDEMRSKCLSFLGFWVFQMLWAFLVSMPVIYVNSLASPPDLTPADAGGIAIFVIGLVFEVGGDLQKLFFKQRPDSRGRHPRDGLYFCMRHPNYSGEIILWWGTFALAVPALGSDAAGWATITSPIFTMLILLFLSGMPSAEGAAQARFMKTPALRDEYTAYRARTPPILPFPPMLYACMPRLARQLFCCEFPMYEYDAPADDSDAETSASLGKGGTPAARADVANPIPDGGYQTAP